jgi:hypothetical protein
MSVFKFSNPLRVIGRDGIGKCHAGEDDAPGIADHHLSRCLQRLATAQALGHQVARVFSRLSLGVGHINVLGPFGILDKISAILDVQEMPALSIDTDVR